MGAEKLKTAHMALPLVESSMQLTYETGCVSRHSPLSRGSKRGFRDLSTLPARVHGKTKNCTGRKGGLASTSSPEYSEEWSTEHAFLWGHLFSNESEFTGNTLP